MTSPIGQGVVSFFKNVFTGDWRAALEDAQGIAEELVGFILAPFDGMVTFFSELPGRLAEGAGDIFGFIRDGFSSAVNWVIEKWNGIGFTLPTMEFDVPLDGRGPYTFGGQTFRVPQIPTLHSGGTFRAPRPGAEGLAILKDGERVGAGVIGAATRAGGGDMVMMVNGRELGRVVRDELRDLSIRDGALPVFTQEP